MTPGKDLDLDKNITFWQMHFQMYRILLFSTILQKKAPCVHSKLSHPKTLWTLLQMAPFLLGYSL
jgi:hypothetical protein